MIWYEDWDNAPLLSFYLVNALYSYSFVLEDGHVARPEFKKKEGTKWESKS